MATKKKALQAAAGAAGGEATYVDDVFSTYLYTGNGSTQTITNDIDLDGEGGMVWVKQRTARSHYLTDTERGFPNYLSSNLTIPENGGGAANYTYISSANADGFSLGSSANVNGDALEYTSWTFRKAPGFFDVVEYSGNGVAGRQIAHNLNSDVGFLIIKRTDSAESWLCWHNNFNGTTSIELNSTGAEYTSSSYWNSTTPTSTHFTVSSHAGVNNSSGTYVAYLFADGDDADAQIFGTDGDQAVVKCGSYTGSGASGNYIDVGFEPQWLLVKSSSHATTNGWTIFDSMRGVVSNATGDARLWPNKSDGEASGQYLNFTADGFMMDNGNVDYNETNYSYIYIAIRRPHKPAESGTEVFNPVMGLNTNTASNQPGWRSPFVADAFMNHHISGGNAYSPVVMSRLTDKYFLSASSTAAQVYSSGYNWDWMNGVNYNGLDLTPYIGWVFKRSPGFFDVVCYEGDSPDSVGVQTVSHNLNVAPEIIIVKRRDSAGAWPVLGAVLGAVDSGGVQVGQGAYLNQTNGFTASGLWGYPYVAPTATEFTVRGSTPNASGGDYIAYLFASQDGISKVGSYTGNGTSQTIDCGFSSGARYVLIKRTDSTSDWNVFDTTRGIVAGNDSRLDLNTSGAQDTGDDCIDPDSSGFAVNYVATNDDDVNVSGGTYIFLAIA